MRFTAASVILAGAAAAQSTITSTATATITDCPATVTDCPADKTSTSVYSYTVSTIYTTSVKTITSCSAKPTCTAGEGHTTAITVTIPQTTTTCILTDEPHTSTKYTNGTSKPPHTMPPKDTTTVKPTTLVPPTTKSTEQPACPTYSVKTISTSTTVVVPTVIYETVSIPCPPAETKPPVKPTPSGGLPGCTGANCTIPKPPPVQAGAAGLTASGLFAAAAGVIAVALL